MEIKLKLYFSCGKKMEKCFTLYRELLKIFLNKLLTRLNSNRY
jgi:hypothetical protein